LYVPSKVPLNRTIREIPVGELEGFGDLLLGRGAQLFDEVSVVVPNFVFHVVPYLGGLELAHGERW